MKGEGHGLVGIGPDTEREIVRLALLSIENQGVGLFASLHVISDGFEGVCPVEIVQETFDGIPVIQTVRRDVILVVDAGEFMLADTLEAEIPYPDFPLG